MGTIKVDFMQNKLLTTVLVFLVCLFLAIAGLLLAETIPPDLFNQRAWSALEAFDQSYQRVPLLFGRNNSVMDYYGDALMYQTTMNAPGKSILENALVSPVYVPSHQFDDLGNHLMVQGLRERLDGAEPNTPHAHYWDGFKLPLRILGSLFDYTAILFINAMLLLAFVVYCSVLLWRFLDWRTSIAFLLSCLLMNLVAVTWCLELSGVIFIFLLGMIAVLLTAKDGRLVKYGYSLFLLLGILTAFFDLFTAPLLSLGFPLIVAVCCLLKSNYKIDTRRILLLGIEWCGFWLLGYMGFWLIKILVTAVFFLPALPDFFVTKIRDYSTPTYSWFMSITSGLLFNLGTMVGAEHSTITYFTGSLIYSGLLYRALAGLMLLILPVLLSVWIIKKNDIDFRAAWLLPLIALLPLLRLLLSVTHATEHSFMTFREWGIAYFAVFSFFAVIYQSKLSRSKLIDTD